ncbi:unnamed protein product [Schistosoma haematobium]|nr:unnamed protein product [Schistosoma haematobium]
MCKRDVMCGQVKIPDQYVGECYQEYYNRLHRTYNNGSGIPSAGYILLVDAINTHTCSGSTAAFASSCLMDEETDRPILGFVNVCPGKMGVDYPEDRNSRGIFLHEIGHALGFSSYNFPFMRFPNGTARTPRDDKRKPKYKDQYGNYVPSHRKIIPFCDTVNEGRCRDAFSYGTCSILRYQNPVPIEDRFFLKAPFDTQYDPEYFGGEDPFKDYCPTMAYVKGLGSDYSATSFCTHQENEKLSLNNSSFCGSISPSNMEHGLPIHSDKMNKRNMHPRRLTFYPYFTESFHRLQYSVKLLEFAHQAMQFWQEALTVKRPEKTNQLAQRYCEGSNNYITYPKDSVCIESRCQIQAKCGHVDVPNEYSSECSEKYNGRLHRLYTNGSGVPSAGYVLLFDGYQTRSCNGNVAAHAGSCLMDLDTDRPILGYVNICPGKLKIEYPENRYSLGIFTHEIAHALGFSSSSFAFMRFPNGTERTPRDHWHKPIHRDKQGYYIPSENTMIKITREWESAEGMFRKDFYSFVTPAILRAAKKHLKCARLDGVDLENQKHRGPISSHWEGKTYGTEIMTGRVEVDYAVSNLTLGFFEDSGWYIVNYRKTMVWEYGKKLGCDFAEKSCYAFAEIKRRKNKTIHPFCDKVNLVTCRDLYSYGICRIIKYNHEIPPEDRFFKTPPFETPYAVKYFGGDDPFKDYCPTQTFVMSSKNDRTTSFCTHHENTEITRENLVISLCDMLLFLMLISF